MNALLAWLDDRTGIRHVMNEVLYERVPGGARWRYVWGSTLVYCFLTQVLTGLALWMAYSPGAQSAWESVYYIQYEMSFGWLLRGIHHFTAQAMIVLLALHLLQVVIDGAYKAPREVNFWLGLILMHLVLGLSLTGYLLPWDQKGYWGTRVATNIAGMTPVVGSQVQQIAIGGLQYGHHTLTRFFALHAGVLPAMLVVFLVLHVAVFRRHGLTVPDPLHKPDTTFWPDQVLKDAVACLAVSATVLFLAIRAGYGPNGGAELGAPAEPSEPYSAARPEWYFLFMFQFLKFFPGEAEVYGAIHIPGLVFGILVLAPIIGRWKVGHYFNVGFLIFILGGAVFLTGWAILEDSQDLVYRKAVADAHKSAARVRELVELKGITSAGAVQLLRDDSLTQGPKLFSRHCGACHRYTDEQHGLELPGQATASDLGHFGTREWAMGMLTDFNGDKHFGATKNDPAIGDAFITGEMAKWVAEFGKKANPDELKAIAEFLYSLGDRADGSAPVVEEAARGMELFALGSDTIGNACFNCHAMKVPNDPMGYFEGAFTAVTPAPDLTGYGSAAWLREFIRNPGADKFYGKRNHMIAFPVEKLSDRDLNMIVEWMLRRWPSRTGNVGSTPAAAH